MVYATPNLLNKVGICYQYFPLEHTIDSAVHKHGILVQCEPLMLNGLLVLDLQLTRFFPPVSLYFLDICLLKDSQF